MKTFREHFITETFKNLFQGDTGKKERYKDQVWDILQKSYAKIGGIKGNGFESPDAMVKKITFWKVATKNGVPKAVVMYKDKNGRKVVAMGTDGSKEGLKLFNDMLVLELKRSWGEYSKAILSIVMKLMPWSEMKKYAIDPKTIKGAMPYNDKEVEKLDGRQKQTLEKYPVLKEFGYFREIGGELFFKVAFGTPGKKIEIS